MASEAIRPKKPSAAYQEHAHRAAKRILPGTRELLPFDHFLGTLSFLGRLRSRGDRCVRLPGPILQLMVYLTHSNHFIILEISLLDDYHSFK